MESSRLSLRFDLFCSFSGYSIQAVNRKEFLFTTDVFLKEYELILIIKSEKMSASKYKNAIFLF